MGNLPNESEENWDDTAESKTNQYFLLPMKKKIRRGRKYKFLTFTGDPACESEEKQKKKCCYLVGLFFYPDMEKEVAVFLLKNLKQ